MGQYDHQEEYLQLSLSNMFKSTIEIHQMFKFMTETHHVSVYSAHNIYLALSYKLLPSEECYSRQCLIFRTK